MPPQSTILLVQSNFSKQSFGADNNGKVLFSIHDCFAHEWTSLNCNGLMIYKGFYRVLSSGTKQLNYISFFLSKSIHIDTVFNDETVTFY